MFILRIMQFALHKKSIALWMVLLTVGAQLWGQEFGVFGKVQDINGEPISFANVLLTRASDSSYVAGTSTDDYGNFSIIPLASEEYKISISFIGYNSFESVFLLDKDRDFQTIVLEENSETLDEISIIAKKPTVTRQPDRLTFNVANTALVEGSTMQVLKSTPGVIVTEGAINVKSSSATIFINNKRVQLTSNELIQLLESAPAEAIKSVEVITNPPASYDADSGVVININMSKNLIAGYRGSIYGSFTQGVYPRYNLGTSQYFKNDKLSFNINYNFTKKKINRDNLGVVNFLDDFNEVVDIWTSDINRTTRSETHNLNLNLDYEIDDANSLSLSATGLLTPFFKYGIFNNTTITDPSNIFLSRFTADNLARDNKYNVGADIGYRHQFKNSAVLRVNAHYTGYDYSRGQNVFSEFFDMNDDFDFDTEFNTDANQRTDIFNGKVDYSTSIGEDTGTFDVGAKFSNVQTDSDITKTDIVNGVPVLDPLNSDAYKYDEKVFAAYVNFSKSWDKWNLTLGLRVEQTNIEGQSISLGETNLQDYLEWFPNLSVLHNISDNTSLFFNYKRSITRPNYSNLNPFRFFLNENTVVVGNPLLQPTFRDYFEIGVNFLKYFTAQSYYSYRKGDIQELPRQNNNTNIIAYIPANLDKTVEYGFDLWVDFYLTDRWSVFALTSFFNITEETQINDDFVSLSQWTNYSQLSNTLSLLKDNSLNINFNLTYASKSLQGLSLVSARLYSDLSISKSLWDDRAVITLSMEDLFNEQDVLVTTEYLNQSNSYFSNLDNRFIKLGFRYKFGNTKLVSNERTSDVQERERIKEREN
ncbi:outer membrane beta-barrel family protein [Winogradskyella aurantiaca]|uniref:outer membrane beta-barrel family protein n=1 Tax=Winogradskyella aurantiaca TaxID=2219558 RepID=UPI001E42E872|nr:outer membrane beta-barrel family protein [Winogradskyella aurantiaca]